MRINHNNETYTYISSVVIRDYRYEGDFEDNVYFICYDQKGKIEHIPTRYCEVIVEEKEAVC